MISIFEIVFSETKKEETEVSEIKIKLLINDGLYKNEDLIKKQSLNLSETQKYNIYSSNQKNAMAPFLLNMLVGFGVGSYVQGDIIPGVICSVGDLLGGFFTLAFWTNGTFNFTTAMNEGVSFVPTLLATTVYLGSRIFECIRPFHYVDSYNKKLKESLGLEDIIFSLSPVMNKDREIQLSMACNIKF